MPKIRKKFITTGIDESYYSIINNINDDYSHAKINDDNDVNSTVIKSGLLSSSNGKYLKYSSSEAGTLPSVLQTTGQILQDYNDPFNETNALEYKSILSNSNVGLPLVTLTQSDGSQQVSVGHYITTDPNLISAGTISKEDSHYVSKYDLSNTKVFDNPNTFDNHMKHNEVPGSVARNIKSSIDGLLLQQTRFNEEYKPFKEDFSNFSIPYESDFYYETIDSEVSKSYNLGKQRQIKIILDFSSENSVDLTLLNTKMTFNLPDSTSNYTEDNLISTKYVNFIEGNAKASYSSHFLPTAYWNFKKNRWNYLDGNLLEFDNTQENNLNLADFPVSQSSDIKYSYLGAKNNTGFSTTISPNFIYSGSNIQSQEIYDKNIKNNVLSVYNKPIVTTPGFRPDGSMKNSNIGSEYNKTAISKITNSYGFPYKQNWQPTNDQLLDMSNYISNDFLLEKISIKGKFTSQGEMPNKKGNFSSGYSQESNALTSTTFNQVYDYKDNFEDYISNNLTFFVLNERKGFNHVKQKINAEPLQSYFFSKPLSLSQPIDYYNVKGKKLDNYIGSYSSYENFQNTLNVYSQIIPNTFIYSVDEYNELKLESNYTIISGANNTEVKNNNSQNIFHFFENISDSSNNETIDSVYIKNGAIDHSLDVLSGNDNKKYNIKLESILLENNTEISKNNFNLNSGRELVTYSNFLIAGKKNNISLDEKTLINIDEKKVIDFNTGEVNININEKEEFIVNSIVKSAHISDYSDESIYKIKSNFKEEIISRQEELSSFNIHIPKEVAHNILTNNLFDFSGSGNDKNGDKLLRILGMPNQSSGFGDFNDLTSYIDDSQSEYHGFTDNVITSDDAASQTLTNAHCTFLNSIFKTTVKDLADGQLKESNILLYFTYSNSSAVNNEHYSSTDVANIPPSVNLQNFITYTQTTHPLTGNDINTNIFFNLRFLDPFQAYGISDSFFNLGFLGFNNNYWADFDPAILKNLDYSFLLKNNTNSVWSSTTSQIKLSNFLKFIYMGIFNATLYNKANGVAIRDSGGSPRTIFNLGFLEFISPNKTIKVKDENGFNAGTSAEFRFFESRFNPYQSSSSNEIKDFFADDKVDNVNGLDIDIQHAFVKFFEIRNNLRGLTEISQDEVFYNINNVLEGKSLGEPNNLGISNERIVDRKRNKNSNVLENAVKSITGKEIKSRNSFDFTENSTYLLKPEDNLIFGVSSNCNGEVAPTVVTLHDKLEITLIGRDFNRNKKHRTNECKSIRKVVTGDSNIQRIGSSVYQTEDSYFDSVWNKSSSFDNLKDFNTKFEIGKNSSRDFGTYTGVISFDKEFNEKSEVTYKADTVQPSLAKVYLSESCLNKKHLYSIDSRDRYEFNKVNRRNIKLPSYKMTFSDSIKEEFLTEYPNRYSKVETSWHKTFHMQAYKEFFQSSENKKIVDYSYNTSLEKSNDIKSNHFVYFDVNSYSAGLNYENHTSLGKKYIENGNKSIITEEISDPTSTHKLIPRYYKSLKTYMLPFSKHFIVQNSLNTENNLYSRQDKFVRNDILIHKNLTDTAAFDIKRYSIQYLLHDIEPEYCDESQDVSYSLFGLNRIQYSSGWCIVLEVDLILFDSLLSNLSSKDYDLFNNSKKDVRPDGENFTVTYYEKNIFLNISEKPQTFSSISDIDLSKTVTKKFKFIKKVYDNSSPTEYFLVAPLHFWETSELDTSKNSVENIFDREKDPSTTSSIVGFGRKSSQFNDANSLTNPSAAWFAKLEDNTSISTAAASSNIYENFLILESNENHENTFVHPPSTLNRKITITGLSTTVDDGPIAGSINSTSIFVPFKQEELSNNLETSAQNLVITRNIILSYASNSLKENNNTGNTYSISSSFSESLNNNFILNKTKKHFISNEHLNNQISLIAGKAADLLDIDESDTNYNINEKVYLSNCKKVVDNHIFDTNSNFVYKIKEKYVEGNNLNNQESYKIIELKGLYNNFTIFKKNRILEQELIFDFESKDKLRVYEDKLLKNVSSYSSSKEFSTPYYEIVLSSNLSTDINIPTSASDSIIQIPYSHYKVDSRFNPQSFNSSLNVEIEDVTDTFNENIENLSSGSPVFMLSENPEGYESKIEQEEKLKEFLYGFSRGVNRYPIQRLDGFKYGVECGSKKSLNHHFKNNSFGQPSDKIMGSANFATARLNKQGNTVFERVIEKRFVNDHFEFVSTNDYESTVRSDEEVFNKDRHCRSYYPYIEDSSNNLSQLNSSNPYFDVSFTF